MHVLDTHATMICFDVIDLCRYPCQVWNWEFWRCFDV